MTNEQFLSIFGNIDESLLRREEKAHKRPAWVRVVSVAACLFLVLGAALGTSIWERMTDHAESAEVSHDKTISADPLQSQETLSWLPPLDLSAVDEDIAGELAPSECVYRDFNSVRGKVVGILPDVYRVANRNRQYRVAELELQELICGKSMPERLYLLIDTFFDAEALAEYDSIVLPLTQLGVEHYVLLNETEMCAEAFDDIFLMASGYRYDELIFAFTDGVLDESLWKKTGWSYVYEHYLAFWLDKGHLSYEEFKLTRGMTAEELVASIRTFAEGDCYAHRISAVTAESLLQNQLSFAKDEWADITAYVKPFENGVFSQTLWVSDEPYAGMQYQRLIYGFATNEIIKIGHYGDRQEIYYSDVRFSAEEIAALPDLGAVISALDIQNIAPPHLPEFPSARICNVDGRYIKHDGEIYGVVHLEWCVRDYEAHVRFWDDLYVLMERDGSYREIPREELQALLGDSYTVSTYPYGTGEQLAEE